MTDEETVRAKVLSLFKRALDAPGGALETRNEHEAFDGFKVSFARILAERDDWHRRFGQLVVVHAESEDEVERLRELVAELEAGGYKPAPARIVELEKEVERLRDLDKQCGAAYQARFDRVLELEAEVKRLRGVLETLAGIIKERAVASAERTQMDGVEVARLRKDNARLDRHALDKNIEVERLRTQLLTCGEEWQKEAERQTDENKRLRIAAKEAEAVLTKLGEEEKWPPERFAARLFRIRTILRLALGGNDSG